MVGDSCNRRGFLKAAVCAGGGAWLAHASGCSLFDGEHTSTATQTSSEGHAGPNPGARRVGYIYDPLFLEHHTGPVHYERAARLKAINSALKSRKLNERLTPLKPRAATDGELAMCHAKAYIDQVRKDIAAGQSRLSWGNTIISPKSFEAASHAAGAGFVAVDAVCRGDLGAAFCAVRPPGHHASQRNGEGFCIFNNAALAARYAQKHHDIERVLIIDWDVHHGNGTQDIFYGDGSVFYFSTHRSPWYPGTGARDQTGTGDGKGSTMNFPFGAGAGRKEIGSAFEDHLVPAMRRFRPQLVIISAGFDSRIGDPLGGFTLTDADFAHLTRVTMGIADAHASGRLVSMLEGGYHLEGLADAAATHIEALLHRGAKADG